MWRWHVMRQQRGGCGQAFKSKEKVSVCRRPLLLFYLSYKLFALFVCSFSTSCLSLGNMSWRVRTIMRRSWKRLVNWFSYWYIGQKWLHLSCHSFQLGCRRTAQRQDGPQGDNGGASEWEWLHLDTNNPRLDLVQQLQYWSGVRVANDDGLKIQGK